MGKITIIIPPPQRHPELWGDMMCYDTTRYHLEVLLAGCWSRWLHLIISSFAGIHRTPFYNMTGHFNSHYETVTVLKSLNHKFLTCLNDS